MKYLKLILVFFFIFSCSTKEDPINYVYSEKIDLALNKLIINKNKWIESNINSYSMNIQFSCFCLAYDPYFVVIEENSLSSVSGNEEWGYEGRPMTINDLFDVIEGKIIEDPFFYEITYNTEYGYPEYSYFDMVEMIADEEIGYILTNFKQL